MPHLVAEVAALPRVAVIVALGRIAFDSRLAPARRTAAIVVRPRPSFGHDAAYEMPDGYAVIGSYHPSRQNTNTGRADAGDDGCGVCEGETAASALGSRLRL